MITAARLLMGSLAGLLALVLGTSTAAACSCAGLSTAEHVAQADVVARVVVEHVNMPVAGANDGQQASYTMRPTYVWQGDVVSQFKVTSEPSGASCGLEGITEGEDLVVFATVVDDGFTANLCGGTAPATDALVSELLDVVGPGVAVDADPGDEPSDWVWPTVAAGAAVVLVVGFLYFLWVRPRRRP